MTSTETLASLIAQKAQLVELLARLSHAQVDLIHGGDMTKLMPVLSAKQQLLTQLQQLEQALAPFRDEDPDQRAWASAAAREKCRSDAQRAEQLLAQIMVLERQAEAEMIRRRDETARRLEEMDSSSRAHSAYFDVPVPVASHFDMSSDR
jgi:flagellar biosynthesis/type III secretory pathway chaperone